MRNLSKTIIKITAMIKFKTLNTSNIILFFFGLILVSTLIAKDLNSKNRDKFDENKVEYNTLEMFNKKKQ